MELSHYANLMESIVKAIGYKIASLGDDEIYAIKLIDGPFHDQAVGVTNEYMEIVTVPPIVKYHIEYEYEFVWCDGCGCYNLRLI